MCRYMIKKGLIKHDSGPAGASGTNTALPGEPVKKKR